MNIPIRRRQTTDTGAKFMQDLLVTAATHPARQFAFPDAISIGEAIDAATAEIVEYGGPDQCNPPFIYFKHIRDVLQNATTVENLKSMLLAAVEKLP